MAQDLKDTLQLPKTDFPMRGDLARREPGRVAHWEKIRLYERTLEKRAGAPAFVLHDGPPFTNGDVHIGTALNKTLKDIVNRYKSMRGFRTPYVPGWDCHGLPIEQKVSREIQEKKLTLTTAELRARCDAFSESWIAKQTAQFKRLGVLGAWGNAYKTKAPAFEADILRTFAAFAEQGLVYRSKKPVYWSIPFETALAEAEIEYKDHVSPSIWVKFAVPAGEEKKFGLPTDKPLSIVIWTTTPWTIPANLAIAVHPEVDYTAIDIGQERIIVAAKLVGLVLTAAKIPADEQRSSKVQWGGKGANLEGLKTRHPFIDRASPVVLADYVTTDSGTGCVHTAPGHGVEDYQTGLKYKLPIYCPVGDDGRYVKIPGFDLPDELLKPEITTLEKVEDLEKKRTSSANIFVLKKLDAAGALLAKQNLTHSYPHCWRSKTPIVFRAVDQWFVGLDRATPQFEPLAEAYTATGELKSVSGTWHTPRNRALREIIKIERTQGWIPAWGEARIRGAVESRPDWCISRQRSWGVPIPVFFAEQLGQKISFEPDANVIRAIADKIEKRGTNYWFESSPSEILEGIDISKAYPGFKASELIKGRDTLDVWFDSGSSHAACLRRAQGGTHWPADLYLEGSDQHRGWFQSSLWTSVIAFGGAPYKAVLTHGFIVDTDRKKISKSSTYEKPQTSDAYVADYGADVIRLWISSQDFRDDIPISKEILAHVGETYRLLRNTFRFQLANLFDFEAARDAVPVEKMDALDRWALHQTAGLITECTKACESYEFHRVYQLCNQFCSVTLSATYHDILKDRLYTLGTNNPLRRSSQTAIHHIFQSLVRLLAPILTFTCDEAWAFATARREYTDDSIHLQDWPVAPANWINAEIEADFAALLRVRAQVNEAIEPLRAGGRLGKSLDAAVTLPAAAPGEVQAVLQRHRESLPELFIVSRVELAPSDQAGAAAGIDVHACGELGQVRCPRCWRWVPALEKSAHGDVCPRCIEALNS